MLRGFKKGGRDYPVKVSSLLFKLMHNTLLTGGRGLQGLIFNFLWRMTLFSFKVNCVGLNQCKVFVKNLYNQDLALLVALWIFF